MCDLPVAPEEGFLFLWVKIWWAVSDSASFQPRSGKFLRGTAVTCSHYPQTRSTCSLLIQLRRAENAGHLYNLCFFPQFSRMAFWASAAGSLAPPPNTKYSFMSLLSGVPNTYAASLISPSHIGMIWELEFDWTLPVFVLSSREEAGFPALTSYYLPPGSLIFHRALHGSWVFLFFFLPVIFPGSGRGRPSSSK